MVADFKKKKMRHVVFKNGQRMGGACSIIVIVSLKRKRTGRGSMVEKNRMGKAGRVIGGLSGAAARTGKVR